MLFSQSRMQRTLGRCNRNLRRRFSAMCALRRFLSGMLAAWRRVSGGVRPNQHVSGKQGRGPGCDPRQSFGNYTGHREGEIIFQDWVGNDSAMAIDSGKGLFVSLPLRRIIGKLLFPGRLLSRSGLAIRSLRRMIGLGLLPLLFPEDFSEVKPHTERDCI